MEITPLKIIAQLIGGLGMAALFISYQQTKRKRLLFCKLCADVAWVAHYLCLGAVGGAIPNFVGIFREIIFMQEDKKWSKSPVFPAIFIVINWALAITTWKSALNLLPICASTAVTISLFVKKPRVTRAICAPVSVCFIIYDIFVGSWIGIINESVALVSIVSSFIKNDLPEMRRKKAGDRS